MLTPNEQIRKIKVNSLRKESLEKELAKTDYKIIKCYEYSLVNLELPYDIQQLHKERENLREQIRSLEI